jgi:hypothetical protein
MPMFPAASPAVVYGLDLTVGGDRYEVRVAKTGPMFASFGLFRQNPATGLWTEVGSLHGGYGTTGQEVVFAIPLVDIGAQNGGRLRNLMAFTALGSFLTGPAAILDQISLRK